MKKLGIIKVLFINVCQALLVGASLLGFFIFVLDYMNMHEEIRYLNAVTYESIVCPAINRQ